MSLWTEMRAYAQSHPGKDAPALARGFLHAHPRRSLQPLLAEEFIHLAREETRRAEAYALASAGGGPRSTSTPRTRDSVRQDLGELVWILNEDYRIGDGLVRRARDMTEEDWVARRVMLTAQANGIQRSIEICNRAIEAIRRARVRTLGDLDDAAAA